MSSAVVNIKTDPTLKAEAQKIASQLGFSLSALINGYLSQLVKTKTIHFSLSEESPSGCLIQALRESEENKRRGKYYTFSSTDKALDFIDKIIKGGNKN